MRRRTTFAFLAVVLLIAGLILLTISLSTNARSLNLLNQVVEVKANTPFTEYGISAPYYLNGNNNGKINGSLEGVQQCCVDFYIFTGLAFADWQADGMNATNSTNSPVLSKNSSSIYTRNGVPTAFSFILDPSEAYALVFYNPNRTLWNGNSSESFHVYADIKIYYVAAPGRNLIYPAAVLLIAGAALVVLSWRKTMR